jgi:hypothetical protein
VRRRERTTPEWSEGTNSTTGGAESALQTCSL